MSVAILIVAITAYGFTMRTAWRHVRTSAPEMFTTSQAWANLAVSTHAGPRRT